MTVYIDTDYIEEIKMVMAYPSVDNVILTDDQIKTFCVWPAMQMYFTKWPIKVEYEASISGATEVDFPDAETYGVMDVRVVSKGLTGGSGTSFWDLVKYQAIGGGAGTAGAYGKKGYNPGGHMQQRMTQMQVQQSLTNQYGTTKFRVSLRDKKVYILSTNSGKLNITWAKYSDDFDDVKFNKQRDLIKLAQANLLDHLAYTTSIVTDSTMDISINSSDLQSRAETLRSSVLEKWAEIPDVILIHG